MRSRFAILLAIAAVCVTTAWAVWTPEALVTSDPGGRNTYANNGHKAVYGAGGVGHLVWAGPGIGSNRYDPSSGWGADYQVSQTGGEPSVALDADGTTIHVIWRDSYLGYRKCTRKADGSDEWGPVTSLYTRQGALTPSVACVPGEPNHVVVCWRERFRSGGGWIDAVGFIECINGVWSTPIRLDSTTTNFRSWTSIGVAQNGDVFISYTTGTQVYVKTRHNGVWGTTVHVTPDLSADRCYQPSIEVNPNTGNPHIVFLRVHVTQVNKKVKDTTSAVYHVYRNSQGAWQSPEEVSVPRHGGGACLAMPMPTMSFASAGQAYATWCEYFLSADHGVLYSYCPSEGGAWGAPVWLTANRSGYYCDDYPHMAVNEAEQTVNAFYSRLYNGASWETEVWWRTSALSDGGMGRSVALSQSGIELFPNPAKAGRVTVQYALPHAGPVNVTLLDVSGRVAWTQAVAATGSRGTFVLDARGLRPGVYVVKFDAGATSLTRKVVVE